MHSNSLPTSGFISEPTPLLLEGCEECECRTFWASWVWVSCRQVCVTGCLCRIGCFLRGTPELAVYLSRTPCFLLGGRVIDSLGRVFRRYGWKTDVPWDLHLELEEFVLDPGWGSWPGLGGRGCPGSVTFERDVSPCELGLMLRGGCSREGVGQIPGGPGWSGDAQGSWVQWKLPPLTVLRKRVQNENSGLQGHGEAPPSPWALMWALRLTDSLPVGGPMDLPSMEAARCAPRSQAEGLWGPPEDGSGVRKSLLIAAWVPYSPSESTRVLSMGAFMAKGTQSAGSCMALKRHKGVGGWEASLPPSEGLCSPRCSWAPRHLGWNSSPQGGRPHSVWPLTHGVVKMKVTLLCLILCDPMDCI